MLAKQVYHAAQAVYHIAQAIYHWKEQDFLLYTDRQTIIARKHNMKQDNSIKRYADAAREYLKLKKIYRYRMKRIEDMSDEEVCEKCHWWYEENNLADDYRNFEDKFFNR